ncbi:MAG: AMP-binding protein [Verrucomicrobiales bacterium]|nr:AMP-binding protein [Verrucomicrobiales bacterium]
MFQGEVRYCAARLPAPPPQISYALNHSGASVLIVHRDRLAELEEAGLLNGLPMVLVVGDEAAGAGYREFDGFVSRPSSAALPTDHADNDLSVMIYTSGTTSRPKGVTLTRGAMSEGIRKYLAWVPLTEEDVTLIAAPVTRPMALRSQLLPILHVGGRVCLIERFSVTDYLAALRRPPAKTFLALLPSALGHLLEHPGFRSCDFSALQLCIAGGDRVAPHLHEAFVEVSGVSLAEQCGASETGFYAMNPPRGRKKQGSVGLPMYGVQVCIVDAQGEDVKSGTTGEITVSSPMMMEGYWNDTALTRKTIRSGRVHTGDLGRFDEDGFLWFMGRKKDVIVRGGSNISPMEVESVLLEHPAVAEACVIGVLDPGQGQVVHAFVVVRVGCAATEEELDDFAVGRLAEYMLPEKFQFLENLPLKGPGKVDRDLLRLRAEIGPLTDRVPLFRDAEGDFIRDIVPHLTCREFGSGETILREGDRGDTMYFLTRGQVEVKAEDNTLPLNTLVEGDYFGELAIIKDVPRLASVRALVDCEVYELKRASVLNLMKTYPRFAEHVRQAIDSYGQVDG